MLLSTDLWVSALLRRVETEGGFAYIRKKGDARAGSILIKRVNLTTKDTSVWRLAQAEQGSVWMQPFKSDHEDQIDAFIDRQCGFDSDLWVIEIEDKEGRAFLTEDIDLS